jgi:hypothetical protein
MFTHVVYLLFEFGVAIITLIAVGTIITKAGYSSAWILVPLTPVIVNVGTLIYVSIVVRRSALRGFFPTGGLGIVLDLFVLDFFLMAVVWIFFLVFAFRPWPALEGATRQSASGPTSPGTTPRPMSSRGASSSTATWSAPVAPTVATRGAVDTRRRVYCPWCGEHIPGNRALGHDCGPKDRPEVVCRFCGQAFAPGSTTCADCDA